MDSKYWHERWQSRKIGFHSSHTQKALIKYGSLLLSTPSPRILVPLCGKSLDMIWLESQGAEVIGVELSPIAARAFFQENGLKFSCRSTGSLIAFEAEDRKITIYQGDFFNTSSDMIGSFTGVYDHAALFALPRNIRKKYTAHLNSLLAPRTNILLVNLTFAPEQPSEGPPFTVSREEVENHFSHVGDLNVLQSEDIIDQNERFRERGVTELIEQILFIGSVNARLN